MNYKKIYEDLIQKWIDLKDSPKDESRYYERHHIVPKCIGGTDEESNIVPMFARDHMVAHMLLALIYPNERDLAFAVVALSMSSKFTEGRKNEVKGTSGKLFEFFRKRANELSKGKSLSTLHRNNLKKPKPSLRKNRPESVGQKISKGKRGKRYGTPVIDNNTGKIYPTLAKCAEDIGYSQATIKYWITNIPSRGYEFYNGKVEMDYPRQKKIIGPDGTIYKSMKECAEKTKHDRHTIRDWINNNPEKGYAYYIEN